MTEGRAQRSVADMAQQIVRDFKAIAPAGQTVQTLEGLIRSTVMAELRELRGREAHVRGAEILAGLRPAVANLLR